ncbi:MAG TPA: tRNA (adenosine(37)-N6)-threonylcarbamoyltransferase complex ATPase subunit type 1 TsaE [Tissierellales bacterium]|nr:tRNA (adenosine(37)-N6)-threonylcarbamoyltransferase complex ATPase subunit type 1 TsaE [Tissierellales bacterium]
MFNVKLNSLEETKKFGMKLGEILKSGDLISLMGDLGAGKTTLTQSIAQGLEINDYVTSPTFTLINEYEGKLPLYHFDVYRLGSIDELYDLGYEEYFYSNGVTIVEWGDKVLDLLPKDRINIKIEKGKKFQDRIIYIYGEGNRTKEIVKEMNIN